MLQIEAKRAPPSFSDGKKKEESTESVAQIFRTNLSNTLFRRLIGIEEEKTIQNRTKMVIVAAIAAVSDFTAVVLAVRRRGFSGFFGESKGLGIAKWAETTDAIARPNQLLNVRAQLGRKNPFNIWRLVALICTYLLSKYKSTT